MRTHTYICKYIINFGASLNLHFTENKKNKIYSLYIIVYMYYKIFEM